mmetsp:Transcript_38325/g.62717  ORF Transcript_38325/g.62717 Transcript_38325/m.62717 type:complete len:201 (-) Transcript_38325:1191-1793(-)
MFHWHHPVPIQALLDQYHRHFHQMEAGASYPNINIIDMITITAILNYLCHRSPFPCCHRYHSSIIPAISLARISMDIPIIICWGEPAAAPAIPAPPIHAASAPKLQPKPVPHYPMKFCLRFSLISLSSQERNLPPPKSTCCSWAVAPTVEGGGIIPPLASGIIPLGIPWGMPAPNCPMNCRPIGDGRSTAPAEPPGAKLY